MSYLTELWCKTQYIFNEWNRNTVRKDVNKTHTQKNYALMVLKDDTYRWYKKNTHGLYKTTVRMDGTKNDGTKRWYQKPKTNKRNKERNEKGKKEWYKMTVRKELVSWCFEPNQPHRVVACQTKHILVVQKDRTERYSQYRKTVRKGGAKRRTDTSCTI